MQEKEFKIKESELQFRTAKISAIDLLSISTQIDFDSLKQTKEVFTFALEHIDVKVEDSWLPVKEQGKDIYWPKSIEDDFVILNALISYFLINVLKPVFTKSEESKTKTK